MRTTCSVHPHAHVELHVPKRRRQCVDPHMQDVTYPVVLWYPQLIACLAMYSWSMLGPFAAECLGPKQ